MAFPNLKSKSLQYIHELHLYYSDHSHRLFKIVWISNILTCYLTMSSDFLLRNHGQGLINTGGEMEKGRKAQSSYFM